LKTVPDGTLTKTDLDILFEHTRECEDITCEGNSKMRGMRQFHPFMNNDRNLDWPIVGPSKLNHFLLRYVMENYVRKEDRMFHKYGDRLGRVPKAFEAPERFCEWVSEEYGVDSNAASKSRLLLQEWLPQELEKEKKRCEATGEEPDDNEKTHHECPLDCPGYYARVWDKELQRWGDPSV